MFSLVTGANGFIGSHLTRVLVERGERVRVLVRPQSDVRPLAGLAVEFAYADLRQADSLPPALSGVQRVYHVAADYQLWAKNPRKIYESNVNGTRNLVAAARGAGIDRFIYTSSVGTIVPRHASKLPDEQTRLHLKDMIGHYKRSKFLAEQEALEAAGNGQPVVIVNPTTPAGPSDWKPTPTGRIILDLLNGRIPTYVDTGLNFVAVEDVAAGHWLAAERGQIGERYIQGDRNLTLKQLLETLSTSSGHPMPRLRLLQAVPFFASLADSLLACLLQRPPRIPLEGVRLARHSMFVDSSKAKCELGFQPGPLKAALGRAIRWHSENGDVKNPMRDHSTRERAA